MQGNFPAPLKSQTVALCEPIQSSLGIPRQIPRGWKSVPAYLILVRPTWYVAGLSRISKCPFATPYARTS